MTWPASCKCLVMTELVFGPVIYFYPEIYASKQFIGNLKVTVTVGLCRYQKECQMRVDVTDTSSRFLFWKFGVFLTKLELILKVFIFFLSPWPLVVGKWKSSYNISFRQQTNLYFFGFRKPQLLATTAWKTHAEHRQTVGRKWGHLVTPILLCNKMQNI